MSFENFTPTATPQRGARQGRGDQPADAYSRQKYTAVHMSAKATVGAFTHSGSSFM